MMSGAQFHMEMKLDGAYHAITNNLKSHKISRDMAVDLWNMTSDMLLKEVNEARSETRHIEAVLGRMETHLKQMKMAKGPVALPNITAAEGLVSDAKAFYGWVFSLYETYISFVDIISPKKAREANINFTQKMQQQLDNEKMTAVVNRYLALLNGRG